MSGRRLTVGPAVLALAVVAGCEREVREFREAPPSAEPPGVVRVSALQPGPSLDSTHVRNADDARAYDVSEGQRLFAWYNCSGCHSNGGGGMGPPLIDDTWIYGSAPENIYATIVEGRPNGMPSFGGRIPTPQVWQLVAYVRSLGGLTSVTVKSARADHMMYQPGSSAIPQPQPGPGPARGQGSSRPAASEMP